MQLYPEFRERLRRRLGSVDLAEEALNEAYVKLRQPQKSHSISNVAAYLFRLTVNTATDQRRAGNRLASAEEIDAAMELADPAPDAARILAGRHALTLLEDAIATMPERRRRVLVAARIDGRSCKDIAQEMGLTKRTVELELRQALDHCAEHLAKAQMADFAKDSKQTSYN